MRATENAQQISLGLYSGIAGLAFTALYLSRGGTRYQKLLNTLERVIVARAVTLAKSVLLRKKGLAVSDFDVISGLAGVGRYFLLRKEDSECGVALRHVLESLVYLAGEDNHLPLWHTPRQFLREETSTKLYPDGNLNCGLAHGCPGILALLSLAEMGGSSVRDIRSAIMRLADWLAGHTIEDEWGINWPTAIPLTADLQPGRLSHILNGDRTDSARYHTSRCAWCYGSPGVARAMWLAGQAAGKPEYQRLGIEAMTAVYRRPIKERRIDSPTFCHGIAGLLQVSLRFARDTGLPVFYEAAAALTDQIRALYQAETLVGFLNIEPGGVEVEQPGLLDGSAGVAISLLAACESVDPTWDALFLLS